MTRQFWLAIGGIIVVLIEWLILSICIIIAGILVMWPVTAIYWMVK